MKIVGVWICYGTSVGTDSARSIQVKDEVQYQDTLGEIETGDSFLARYLGLC